jgi:hypothetical protein
VGAKQSIFHAGFSGRKVDSSSMIFHLQQSRSLSFFAVAHNDRGYGHGRFAGVFAIVKRQSECGRKDR